MKNDQPDSGQPNKKNQRQHPVRVTCNRGNQHSTAFNWHQTPVQTIPVVVDPVA